MYEFSLQQGPNFTLPYIYLLSYPEHLMHSKLLFPSYSAVDDTLARLIDRAHILRPT